MIFLFLCHTQNFSYPDTRPLHMPLGKGGATALVSGQRQACCAALWWYCAPPSPLLMPCIAFLPIRAYIFTVVVSWNFSNLAEHPLHLHTNPFTIAALPNAFLLPNTSYTNWFEVKPLGGERERR